MCIGACGISKSAFAVLPWGLSMLLFETQSISGMGLVLTNVANLAGR